MSMYRVSVLNLWRSTEETEQKKIIGRYIQKYGEHYTHDEFLTYLEKKYRSRISPYTLPINSREQEY